MRPSAHAAVDPEALRRRLATFPPGAAEPPALPGQVPAAVLVPLVPGPAGWYLLLIRRTEGLTTHGGEMAFPGGRVEAGETTRQAALREAQEELGLDPSAIEVLGALPQVDTRVSRHTITPWVGVLHPGAAAVLRPSPDEVAAVVAMPWEALASPAARRDQRFIRGRRLLLSPAYDAAGVTVWGATARILCDLLERLVPPDAAAPA